MTLTSRDIIVYIRCADKLVRRYHVFMDFLSMDCSIKMERLVKGARTGEVNVVIYNVYTCNVQHIYNAYTIYIK
jgi:hypothetical protein